MLNMVLKGSLEVPMGTLEVEEHPGEAGQQLRRQKITFLVFPVRTGNPLVPDRKCRSVQNAVLSQNPEGQVFVRKKKASRPDGKCRSFGRE